MKNIPQRIFIQIGEDNSEIAGEFDFNKLVGITWSTERKYKTDLEFVLKKGSDKKIKDLVNILRMLVEAGISQNNIELVQKTINDYDREERQTET